MPDFAPNWTARIRFRYSSQGATHSFTVRAPRGVTGGDYEAYANKMIVFLNAVRNARFNDWTLISVTACKEDDNVFLPQSYTTALEAGIGGGGDPTQGANVAQYMQFVGRSALGLKGSFYLFGVSFAHISATGKDYRITATESAEVSAGIAALTDVPPVLVGNDGATMSWYPYVNLKEHDYWVHRSRP